VKKHLNHYFPWYDFSLIITFTRPLSLISTTNLWNIMTTSENKSANCVISVYLDDGRVFNYTVESAEKAREHAYAIATTGYRHCVPGILEHYPAHRISKVKARGADIGSSYADSVSGT
jgi:predicted Zn-dependent protease